MRRVALLLTIACGQRVSPPADHPVASPPPILHLSFDDATPAQPLGAWSLAPGSADAGWSAAIVSEGCPAGTRCAKLVSNRPEAVAPGALRRRLDAAPYRGKRIRVRGAVQAQVKEPRAGARLILRVLGPDDTVAATQRSARAVSGAGVTDEVIVDGPGDAAALELSLSMYGTGQGSFADLIVEAIGPAGEGWEPPRPLAGRALDNLVAFARLYGYVRYFHASDQAAAADWNRVAIAGVRAGEGARDPAELARALARTLGPLSPSLEVFPTADKPAAKPAAAPAGARVVAWEHHGLGIDADSTYQSWRAGLEAKPGIAGEAGLTQDLAAAPYRGGRVRLRAWVRTEVTAATGQARLYVDVRGPGGKSIVADEMDDRPIVSPGWQRFEIVLPVAAEAEQIGIGFELRGRGRACVDDVTLDRLEPKPASISLANADLEGAAADGGPAGWSFYTNPRGYAPAPSRENPHGGKQSACLEWAPTRDAPTAPLESDLPGGVSIRLPLAVYADGEGTLPRPTAAAEPAPEPAGFIPSGDDRATRLADVIIAWNVFQHFYPYFDVVTADWPGVLRQALASAATDKSAVDFAKTLRRLVAALHDGHGRVNFAGDDQIAPLPLTWEWIEGALVVTAVGPSAGSVRRGDVVRRIDGRPVAELIAAREALISAATPGWARFRSLMELRSGLPGRTVELSLERAGGAVETVKIAYDAEGKTPFEEPRPDKIATLEPGIMYVDLGRITDEDFTAALPELAKARGIVFDLRGYPKASPMPLAHLTSEAVRSARWMIPRVVRPDRAGMTFDEGGWPVQPVAPRLGAKVAFLTDGRAISYAETYMGIVEAYHLAAIVGAPTAGTNGNINPFILPGGYTLWWTGMKVLKRDGSQHHGVGIKPTVPAARTRAGVAAGRDEVLEAGVAVVKGKE
jgi:C-terminal processing protease CtpA/Prc